MQRINANNANKEGSGKVEREPGGGSASPEAITSVSCAAPPGRSCSSDNEKFDMLLHGGGAMADHMTVTRILSEVEQLSYSDRMRLVESIVRSVRMGTENAPDETTADNPEALFGIWRNREVTLEGIRGKAWRRP